MIKFIKVHKNYITANGQIDALVDINLIIESGEIFGIIGKSGAGKSSLLRCINLLDKPSSGSIFVDQVELNKLSDADLRQLRRQIGMIFQHFNLLESQSVFDNIALPLRLQGLSYTKIRNKIIPLLELVELIDKQHAYPKQLSGGQKQRVAIARALAHEPKILLCDEATSALDPQTTNSVLQLLKKINQQMQITLVLITHEMEVIKTICDRVAVMSYGRIIEQSDIFSLFSQPKHQLSQQLVANCLQMQLPQAIKARLHAAPKANTHPLLQLHFYDDIARQPFIANLVRETGIHVNILQANIDYIKQHALGVMVLEVMTEPNNLDVIMDKCKQQKLSTEIIGYVENDLA